MNEVSKTFCILPWIHMYINPDGTVLPCCIAQQRNLLGNVQSESINNIWNGEKYKTLRRKMIAGEKCDECSACYISEENNIESFRQSKLKRFKNHITLFNQTNIDGSLNEMNLKYFDIRWSNICNFKCRSCNSLYSSSWATEDINNLIEGNYHQEVFIFAGGKSNDHLYDQFIPYYSDMEEIYFAGGEPLLTDKHYDLLEYLISINKTKVSLTYNTNLSNLKYKNKNVIDLWKKFSDVSVYASLDSWGSRAEYIREGTEWEIIESNLKKIQKEIPHVNLQMSSVISAFNVNTLPEFLNYLLDNNLFKKENFFPNFYNLITPHQYSFKVLPDDYRKKTIDKLSSKSYSPHIDKQISGVISVLSNTTYDPLLQQKFQKNNIYYDSIRHRNFIETFPEMENFCKLYNKN